MAQKLLIDIRHPYYEACILEWIKWRLCYEGGQNFINTYLKKFSKRETNEDFEKRKEITYNPSFASSAVDEIKNSIFQRMFDISRKGGSKSYQQAVLGMEGGVDLEGHSMNSFIGVKVLPELLPMARVGLYLDMPNLLGITVAENKGIRPYLYTYPVEDILSWNLVFVNGSYEVRNVLLRDNIYEYDAETGLPSGETCKYKHLWLDQDGFVHVKFYDGEGTYQNEQILNIQKIPLYISSIRQSLLTYVANYQIALLNLGSSDMAYALQSNFPFYTEQFDFRNDSTHFRAPGTAQGGESKDAVAAKPEEVKVGSGAGRRYGRGLERPGFIHPSSEPLRASMEKQSQLKEEIRQLVNLAVTNLNPQRTSAESKAMDQQGLETGLSYIGLELENAERKIAEFWKMYEGGEVATIKYPTKYSLRTEEDQRAEAKELANLLSVVPSKTYQKVIAKRIANVMVGNKVSNEDMVKIESEINSTPAMTCDTDTIAKDVEIGILDLRLASKLKGYPDDTVDKAEKDHENRLKRIQIAQAENGGAARGVKDIDGDVNGSSARKEKKESRDTTQDDVVTDKTRGEGQ